MGQRIGAGYAALRRKSRRTGTSRCEGRPLKRTLHWPPKCFVRAWPQPMRRDPGIPHWTTPVPPETEYDSNTHARQVTQSCNRAYQCGMHVPTHLMHLPYSSAFQGLRRHSIGLILLAHECSLTVDECQDLAGNYEEYCDTGQNVQGAGPDSRHRLSVFARGAAMFMVR